MIYDNLSKYYDALVKDDEATLKWVEFVKKHSTGTKILELACGSGEITNALYKEGYDILATDFSIGMLEQLHLKYPNIKYKDLNMIDFKVDNSFDTIICFCDSINYLNDLNECKSMFISVYNALNDKGYFIFDMHTKDRLNEFEEEFLEEGYIDDVAYQWTINTEDNHIHHHFAFYTPKDVLQEYHVQTVFELNDILNLLNEVGFNTKVYTDFNYEGIKDGEKYFIVGGKI